MMRSSDRRVRNVPFFGHVNISSMDRRKLGLQHILICHDIRRFSNCFNFPGCSDLQAAFRATVQYHMLYGKNMPAQVFLAFLGYGKQMCEQSCSSEALNACKRGLRQISETEESNLMSEAVAMSERISRTDDVDGTCDKFKRTLTDLMRVRSEFCGEAAKCLCMEEGLQKGISYCNAGCEHLLREGMTSSSSPFPLLSLLLPLLSLL